MKHQIFIHFSCKCSHKNIFAALFVFVSCALSQISFASNFDLFLSGSEIKEIQALIFDEKSLLHKSEYENLIAKANKVLTSEPPTITENKSPKIKNHYFTEGPYCGWFNFWGLYGDYCRDGQVNPNANREDYREARRMGVDSVVLGLAFRLSGNREYLDKLFEYFDSWIIQSETRMLPQFTNPQSRIEIAVSHIALLYGISLVMDEVQKVPVLKKEINTWLRSWSYSVDSWQEENNFEDWRLTMRLAIFSLLNDSEKIQETVDAFKARLTTAISDEGKLIHELSRTKSLGYSLYALNAMLFTAEIAYHRGIDLYRFKDERGVGLEKALLFHADFLINDSELRWPYKQIGKLQKREMAFFELANKRYKQKIFIEVIDEWQRPFTEIWALQYISLTHSTLQNN